MGGIQSILKNGDPYNASLYSKYSTLYCCCNVPFIVCLLLIPFAVFYFVVALNAQQPQIMIQGANGQQMMVQGKKAIVNGREVLLVEQPSNIHQQQQQHIVPAMSNQSSANVPLSTEHGDYYNGSAPEEDDPPPAYNPMANDDHQQTEGGAATFS